MICKRSLRIFLACPNINPILNPVMKIIQLTQDQLDQVRNDSIKLVDRTSFPPVDPTMDLEEFFKTIRPPNEHKSEPVVNKAYKPKTITLPAEIVELVMNNCSDGEPPQNKEEWNDLIAEIVEEYFNY